MSALFDLEFWSFVAALAGIYAVFALGLQVQFGYSGLLNFGHVASMAVAAYTMAVLVIKAGMALWLASLIGIGMAIVLAVLVGLPTLRLRGDYLAITTLAFAEIIRYVVLNEEALGGTSGSIALRGLGQIAYYNNSFLSFQARVQDGLGQVVGEDVAGRDFTMMVIIWTVAIVLFLLVRHAVRSPWGRVLRSIREDEDAAAALGKNVFLYKLSSLVLGAVLGGIAGLLFAYQFSFFDPSSFEPLTTFYAWIIIILGGIGRLWGVPVGALLFAAVIAGTRFLDFLDSAERAYLRLMVIGVALIALMAFRPQGIFGKRREMVLD